MSTQNLMPGHQYLWQHLPAPDNTYTCTWNLYKRCLFLCLCCLAFKCKHENWFQNFIHFTAHTINCVCHSIRSMFIVLGLYNFGTSLNFRKNWDMLRRKKIHLSVWKWCSSPSFPFFYNTCIWQSVLELGFKSLGDSNFQNLWDLCRERLIYPFKFNEDWNCP